MKFIKHFLIVFSVMFTVTNITFSVFNLYLDSEIPFVDGILQCVGLALIFTVVLLLLDYCSNYLIILNSSWYVVIQYLLLLTIIVSWAMYFQWGDWGNYRYILVFVSTFTAIYALVYVVVDTRYKREDKNIIKSLERYQKKIKQ